ncbi:F-actin-uncapping protein LRRC16A-like isoform X2 [Dendronephthya gigantea]|uniref:F-actin-uncapping protein LRRC16A-like isoform X2 n=1 Tax=Dendronephthya gigantea TaxID=151771 RepID=UPI00106C1A64|nr:F-actin-uncapping protein LRRC16A-like isoform X2 [Dendronephthya gigantea]
MAAKENDSPNIEKGLILAAIGKSHEVQLVKGIKLELRGGDKIDSRILVVTSFRFYILTANKAPYKVDLSVHILDIHAIESKKADQIAIQYGEKQVKFSLTKPGSTHVVLGQLIANLKINFPGGNLDELIRKDIEPGEKLESINNAVNKLTSSESLSEAGPCGGFSHSYSCICNHMGVPFLEEVAWDVDTIYLSNDTKEFNIQDFDHLEPRELIPILTTLEYNAWFTRLVCVSYKLSAEILDVITKVIKRSTTIEEIVLDGVSLGREFCQKLANALTSNPKSALESIDLSRNPSAEDRGVIHMIGSFSKISHGLSSLVLHETGITNKAASTVGQMLKSSKYMSTSLTRLDLSSNPIKADGVTAICDFLAQANALTHVDLSSTECFVESIFGALIRGCCQNLSHLNLSGNQFTNRKSKDTNLSSSYQQFFSSTGALKEIKLSECRLPADAVRALFLGLIENTVVKDVAVDISKNELKSAGLRAMTGPLSQISNLYSLDLSDNGFESDIIPLCESLCENKALKKLHLGQNCHKGRNLNNIMEGLIKLISVENSPIEYLNLADSRFKQNITLLFDSLGTNESLVELDISGNMMGDEGARVLAKALQINSKLRTIHLDRNNVTQSGFRDIALSLENNLTLQSMPIPLNDVSLCLKPATEKALKQIEKCLSRNHSPSKAVTEQVYRLQQGLMMTSTQQQMVDKLIVQLQDTARLLRNSPDETVQSGLRNALKCINDADKLKQLFLKFHMQTSTKDMEERLSSLASDIYNSIQQQVQENKEKILKSAETNCPFVTEQQSVKDNLKTACEGKANVSKAFIDTLLLQQLAPIILNEVSEKNLNLSTAVVDTLMDEVISQLENQQALLDILVNEHKTEMASVGEKPAETEEPNDNISEAAQKAKNRLSAVNNRRSVRFPDAESEVFNAPSHPRRRPTINRKRRTSDITEEHADSGGVKGDSKKKEAVVPDIDLSVSLETPTNGLVHVTKNRPRPARGRRPPTRATGGQQNTAVGPETVDENFDAGIESFFNKPVATRPQSAALPASVKVVPESSSQRSATINQRTTSKKHEKEEAEDKTKVKAEKKLGILSGFFGKKKNDKKSPSASRKESKKDLKKSQEDVTDAGPAPEKKPEPKSSPRPEERHNKPEKPVDKPEKPVDKPEKPVDKPEKPAVKADKQPKKPPQRPHRPEKPVSNEVGKPAEPETKPVVAANEPVDEPSKEIKVEENKDRQEDKEDSGKQDGGKQDGGKQNDGEPDGGKQEEEKKEGEDKKEGKQEGEKQEGGEHERGEKEGGEVDSTKGEEEEKPKPQPKAPPKFGVGLPMGAMGGDLLAEMKKRNQRNSEKKPSPEPKPRPRVGTNPDAARPVVPVRPSSMKRSVKAKSAADLTSVVHESKPTPQPRAKEDDKEERRMSNEASKPVPPKPAPKGKPQVAARASKPNVPKRPPSINKEKRKSLDAEKRKSLEAETAAEKAPETKPKEETPVKQEETVDATKTKDKKTEDEVVDEQPEEAQEAPKIEPGDKPSAKEEPQELEDEKALGEEEKPDDSALVDKDSTPEKDASEKQEKDTSEEVATDTKTESTEVPDASTSNTSESTNESEASKEGEQTTDVNEVPDKQKDTNDNETDVTTVVSEETTEKVEPVATDAESDDVIKSAVDEDTLKEALSAKDTAF